MYAGLIAGVISGGAAFSKASLDSPCSPRCLANVGILSLPDPGHGSSGVPTSLLIISADHLWSGEHLMMPAVLKTPSGVPTMFSPDCTVSPSQMPFSKRSSKSPTFAFVFGILNSTASPNGIIGLCDLWPLMRWSAVRPHGCTLHRVMMYAACLTIHGTIF